MVGQYDLRGNVPESMRLSIAAYRLLDIVPTALRCAQVRKLSWLAKHGWKNSIELYFDHDCECCGSRVVKATIFGFPGGCWLCSKTVSPKCSLIITENTLEQRFLARSASSLDEPIGTRTERQSWLLRGLRPADTRKDQKYSRIRIPDTNQEMCSRRQLVCQPCSLAAEREEATTLVVEGSGRL